MATRQRGRLAAVATMVAAATLIAAATVAGSPTQVRRVLPPETIAARQLFFGAENVDPATGDVPAGEVHLSWVSVATFAAAIDGHVVLLDGYIHKQEDRPNYVPATFDDLVDLKPEFILLGHGHFDHAILAGPIAAATSATVIGSQSHCDEGAEFAGTDISCVAIFDGDSAFGDVATVELWDGICTTAVLHVHSAAEPPDPSHDPTNTVVPVPDAGNVLLHPPGFLIDGAGDEGGTILYQFRVGPFSLTWHDSSGPLKEVAPEVFDVLRALPPTDVELGAILGFNQITNGLRDPAMYAAAIDAQVYIPNHHDFVTEYGSADEFEPVLLREFEDYGANAEVRFLYDPYDYVRPNLLAYDIDAPRWKQPGDEVCPASQG